MADCSLRKKERHRSVPLFFAQRGFDKVPPDIYNRDNAIALKKRDTENLRQEA